MLTAPAEGQEGSDEGEQRAGNGRTAARGARPAGTGVCRSAWPSVALTSRRPGISGLRSCILRCSRIDRRDPATARSFTARVPGVDAAAIRAAAAAGQCVSVVTDLARNGVLPAIAARRSHARAGGALPGHLTCGAVIDGAADEAARRASGVGDRTTAITDRVCERRRIAALRKRGEGGQRDKDQHQR